MKEKQLIKSYTNLEATRIKVWVSGILTAVALRMQQAMSRLSLCWQKGLCAAVFFALALPCLLLVREGLSGKISTHHNQIKIPQDPSAPRDTTKAPPLSSDGARP